ncbi:TorD/DmsD family molecular chaperone [Seleniivibrio woodruffii]|uniref:TorD/DmsD family molecular chaperone n=1 Tax=Seleniivibrio woodruffii TaxID=1078050 RepID=UPI00240A8CC8|nr:molecular chaperone TorD family protein [Seleniivibrio woodruffii]
MFEYKSFKENIASGSFDNAKALLKEAEIDTESFNALANASMFLSLLFRYPDDEVYDTLEGNWSIFTDFFTDYTETAPSLYDQTEMQSDFIKLFKQDFKGSKVVPYISYYTEEKKTLYGESTFRIREWMAAEGFALQEDVPELEDNVYIVLEFLSAIFARLANPENIEQWYATLQNLYRLIDTYGKVITDEFAEQVAKRAEMPFYAHCGVLLKNFVSDIDGIMEEVLASAG